MKRLFFTYTELHCSVSVMSKLKESEGKNITAYKMILAMLGFNLNNLNVPLTFFFAEILTLSHLLHFHRGYDRAVVSAFYSKALRSYGPSNSQKTLRFDNYIFKVPGGRRLEFTGRAP